MGSESYYMNFVALIVNLCGAIWLWHQGTELDIAWSIFNFSLALANMPFAISWFRYLLDVWKTRKAKENRVGLK